MEAKRLMKVTYQDLKKGIRLNAYADAVIWSEDPSPTLAGLRFGGYAEVVRGLTDAIYGGATIEIEDVDGSFLTLKSLSKQYRREVSHEGLYAEATLIAEDEIQESSKSQDEKSRKHAQKDDLFDDNVPQQDIPAHICYIFCHPGNEDELFQAIDQKSYVPMIPEYQDYVLAELKRRRILRPLRVRSLYQELEAWKLCCEAKDQNLVRVMEDGLKRGKIKIPGASPGPSLLDGVHSVTDYLNTFGVTVAERIKKLFVPLFDPAAEPLSGEVLDINEYVRAHAGYGQPAIKHPFDGYDIVKPKDTMPPGAIMPKDQMVLKIAEEKIAAGGKVLIYTNWTRLDTPKRLLKLVTERGWNATILEAKVKPEAREDWVQDRLDHGLQVLIGNPSLVETGLDLNAFTTLIFYDTGYKLFTLRQASLRSWRINQSAPRVEVYMLYHAGTMQHKAIKLMASKLAAAGMIEGSFSEEGLSAMSECEDMTTLMARELMMGIKDSVEDLAATFKRMAMLKPQTAAWSIFSDEVRKTDSAVLGRSSPSILEFTFGTEERTVPQAAVLPQDSPVFFETAKAEHKRKKGEVDEDQLLLFQIA